MLYLQEYAASDSEEENENNHEDVPKLPGDSDGTDSDSSNGDSSHCDDIDSDDSDSEPDDTAARKTGRKGTEYTRQTAHTVLGHPDLKGRSGRIPRSLHRNQYSEKLGAQMRQLKKMLRKGYGGSQPQAPITTRKTIQKLRTLLGFAAVTLKIQQPDLDLLTISPSIVDKFIQYGKSERDWSAGTVANYFNMLISVYTCLYRKRRELDANPGHGAKEKMFYQAQQQNPEWYKLKLEELKKRRNECARVQVREKSHARLMADAGVESDLTAVQHNDLVEALRQGIQRVNESTGKQHASALRDATLAALFVAAIPTRAELRSVRVRSKAPSDKRYLKLLKGGKNYVWLNRENEWIFFWGDYKNSSAKGIDQTKYSKEQHPMIHDLLTRYIQRRKDLLPKRKGDNRYLFVSDMGEEFSCAQFSHYVTKTFKELTGGKAGICINEIRHCQTTDFRLSEHSKDPSLKLGFEEGMRHSARTADRHYDQRTRTDKIGLANALVYDRALQRLQEGGGGEILAEFQGETVPQQAHMCPSTAVPANNEIVGVLGKELCSYAKVLTSSPSTVTVGKLMLLRQTTTGDIYKLVAGSAHTINTASLRFPVEWDYDSQKREYTIYTQIQELQNSTPLRTKHR